MSVSYSQLSNWFEIVQISDQNNIILRSTIICTSKQRFAFQCTKQIYEKKGKEYYLFKLHFIKLRKT